MHVQMLCDNIMSGHVTLLNKTALHSLLNNLHKGLEMQNGILAGMFPSFLLLIFIICALSLAMFLKMSHYVNPLFL